MLIRLSTKIGHVVKHACLMFQKNLSSRSYDFTKSAQIKKLPQNDYANDLRKTIRSRETPVSTKLSRGKIVSERHILTVFSSHFIKTLIIFRCIYYYYAKTKDESVFTIYFKTNIQIFFAHPGIC